MNITSIFLRISIYEWVIIGLYLLFFIVQLFYYLYLFRKPYQHAINNDTTNEAMDENDLPGITVIITARNEAENLQKNLPFILNQDYPNFQVVVVNSSSTDNTDDVLNRFRHIHPNLYVTYIPKDSKTINAKKLALTLGIKAAKHDILLFTEPDTKPLSERWVYQYAKTFKKGKDIVLGCCQIEINKSCFRKYIQFDNLFIGIKYLSMALAKKPYMGIGRNMAFKKDLFFENKGFSSVLNIEDGEDDVFINRIATKENTAIVVSPESTVVSNAVEGLSTWKNIKTRYLTTRKYLSGNTTKLLTFEVFSRYAFYMLFLTLCLIGILSSFKSLVFFAVLMFLIRLIMQMIVLNKNSKVFNAGKFHFSLPLLDLMVPAVNYLFLNSETNRGSK